MEVLGVVAEDVVRVMGSGERQVGRLCGALYCAVEDEVPYLRFHHSVVRSLHHHRSRQHYNRKEMSKDPHTLENSYRPTTKLIEGNAFSCVHMGVNI